MSRFRLRFTIRRLMAVTVLVALAFGGRSAWQRWRYGKQQAAIAETGRRQREAIALATKAFGGGRWGMSEGRAMTVIEMGERGFWAVESADRPTGSTCNVSAGRLGVRFKFGASRHESDAPWVEAEEGR